MRGDIVYKKGTVLRVTRKNQEGGNWSVGDIVTVTQDYLEGRTNVLVHSEERQYKHLYVAYYEVQVIEMCSDINKQMMNSNNKGVSMNEVIAKLFPKTADAVLVENRIGAFIKSDEVEFIRLDGKQKELLAEAQRLEDLRNKTT